MIGSVIENYKIISVLGEGGMGVVYKALDMKLERFVALKPSPLERRERLEQLRALGYVD